jgi:hypothetical protein
VATKQRLPNENVTHLKLDMQSMVVNQTSLESPFMVNSNNLIEEGTSSFTFVLAGQTRRVVDAPFWDTHLYKSFF